MLASPTNSSFEAACFFLLLNIQSGQRSFLQARLNSHGSQQKRVACLERNPSIPAQGESNSTVLSMLTIHFPKIRKKRPRRARELALLSSPGQIHPQELAPTFNHRLPGFTGPVPQPLLMRTLIFKLKLLYCLTTYRILIHFFFFSKQLTKGKVPFYNYCCCCKRKIAYQLSYREMAEGLAR